MRTLSQLLAALMLMSMITGCMHQPYNYYGNPYQQPMYAPPANLSNQPGTLYIPPSDAPPYDPGSPSTYDEPTDSWSNPGSGTDSRFFGEDQNTNPVPDPRDAGSGAMNEPFRGDFNRDF